MAESTKELTAEGAKVVTVATDSDATAAAPSEPHPEPTAEAIGDMQAAFGTDPSAALAVYSSSSKLVVGLKSDVTLPGGHSFVVDEPPMMPGGMNAGPNPLDIFCAALGTCQEITYKAYATAMGIKLNSVACAVAGDVDLRGFLGVDGAPRTGFIGLTGTITIDAPGATAEQLAMLKGAVDAHCPMCDTICNSVPLDTSLVHVEAAAVEVAEPETLKAEAIGDMQAAMGADAAAGLAKYSSSSKLEKGLMTNVTFPSTPEHSLVVDEPPMMPGGANAGPNPLDVMLAALGTCQEITYKAYATAMGLKVNSISAAASGDVDLRGFLGVDGAPRNGFIKITCAITIESPEPKEKLEMLKGAVDAHCPMCDTLCNSVPLTTTMA